MKKSFILFLVIIFLIGFAVFLHTNNLEITRHKIELGSGGRRLLIAHVSDLHTNGLGLLEKQTVNAIEENNVDAILITGDIATPGGTLEGYQDVLEKLKAPKGVFFVPGNWEYWEPIKDLEKILKDHYIIDLTNKTMKLGENLWLIGFDDIEGIPSTDQLIDVPKSDIKIGLFHSPQFFNNVSKLTNLNFAGHSHGGQIRLPLLGSVWTPSGTGPYEQGWYKKNESQLFVSRGIGTSILPIRFLCSPELALIEIHY